MASNQPKNCCTIGTLHEGTPTGKLIKLEGGFDAYLSTAPDENPNKGIGILFAPEAMGIYPNSQLLADSFAAKGYTTLIPDVFNGDAVPLNKFPTIDLMSWLTKGSNGNNPHTTEHVDPIIVAGIKALRQLGIHRIGGVGYCFGAKYVLRHFKSGLDVAFIAHPSFVEENELAALSGPLSIAAAETDSIFTTAMRHKSEEILIKTGQPFQINLFSGVEHGFGIRGDPAAKIQKFAKEQAFSQAIAWFNEYLLKE
ncbi:esterase/lipase [Trichoderma harzianum]|uniref:Esterase/lipase n=1 Tax=Trichoderma harzianum TaxID=5544 RepID=A0A0F9ZBA1_TRIHA|nr:esterase/lipase [Trichoderma harzianum]